MQIAIDGPSASGKSTIAKIVAERLGYRYLDTGAMYRTVTAMALRRGVDPSAEEQIVEMLREQGGLIVLSDEEIRSEEVNLAVSAVSAHLAIREYLIRLQRGIAENESVVMDGRDIGSVVLKNAELKIYLDADVEVRAMRRAMQSGAAYEEELESIKRRDYLDSHRKHGPLIRPKDAIVIDTTEKTMEDVVQLILQSVERIEKENRSSY